MADSVFSELEAGGVVASVFVGLEAGDLADRVAMRPRATAPGISLRIIDLVGKGGTYAEIPPLSRTGFDDSAPIFLSPLRPADSAFILRHMPDTPESDPRFHEFVILQAQNAGLFLGQIPHPHTGEKTVNLRAAKSVIDSLEMLASKTRGNLAASETKLLAIALQNLKQLYQSALPAQQD